MVETTIYFRLLSVRNSNTMEVKVFWSCIHFKFINTPSMQQIIFQNFSFRLQKRLWSVFVNRNGNKDENRNAKSKSIWPHCGATQNVWLFDDRVGQEVTLKKYYSCQAVSLWQAVYEAKNSFLKTSFETIISNDHMKRWNGY